MHCSAAGDLDRQAVADLQAERIRVEGWTDDAWLLPDDVRSWKASNAAADRVVLLPYRDPFVWRRRPVSVLTARPGFTSTWGGGPYYGPLWKRIDYALVRGGRVADIQLFNDQLETLYDPATGAYRQNVKDCKASDHAGLVVTVE